MISLAIMLKGLPLAYGKDMQEDKEPVFEAADALALMIAATAGMVRDMTPDAASMRRAAESGFATATDLADWLVREAGLPFREAHHATGALVALAERKGCGLADLTLSEMRTVDSRIDEGVFSVLTVERSVESRRSEGGTAPDNVRRAIAVARERFRC
jgi:argininosuccinate lyase